MLHNTIDLHFAYGPVFGVNYNLPYVLERKYPNAEREWMRMKNIRMDMVVLKP